MSDDDDHMRRRTAGIAYGALWLGVGVGLLTQGLRLFDFVLRNPAGSILFEFLTGHGFLLHHSGSLLLAAALLIGWVKGKTVLTKTSRKYFEYLKTQQEPIAWRSWLQPKQWVLLLGMGALGVCARLYAPGDLRAVVCVAVGTALIQAGWWTLRQATGISSGPVQNA